MVPLARLERARLSTIDFESIASTIPPQGPPQPVRRLSGSAAGCLLVREAGGFVSDYRGRSLPICAEQVVAGNDALHSKLHKLVAGALKD